MVRRPLILALAHVGLSVDHVLWPACSKQPPLPLQLSHAKTCVQCLLAWFQTKCCRLQVPDFATTFGNFGSHLSSLNFTVQHVDVSILVVTRDFELRIVLKESIKSGSQWMAISDEERGNKRCILPSNVSQHRFEFGFLFLWPLTIFWKWWLITDDPLFCLLVAGKLHGPIAKTFAVSTSQLDTLTDCQSTTSAKIQRMIKAWVLVLADKAVFFEMLLDQSQATSLSKLTGRLQKHHPSGPAATTKTTPISGLSDSDQSKPAYVGYLIWIYLDACWESRRWVVIVVWNSTQEKGIKPLQTLTSNILCYVPFYLTSCCQNTLASSSTNGPVVFEACFASQDGEESGSPEGEKVMINYRQQIISICILLVVLHFAQGREKTISIKFAVATQEDGQFLLDIYREMQIVQEVQAWGSSATCHSSACWSVLDSLAGLRVAHWPPRIKFYTKTTTDLMWLASSKGVRKMSNIIIERNFWVLHRNML